MILPLLMILPLPADIQRVATGPLIGPSAAQGPGAPDRSTSFGAAAGVSGRLIPDARLQVVWIVSLPFRLCLWACGVKPVTEEEAATRAAAQHEATAADPAAATQPSERV